MEEKEMQARLILAEEKEIEELIKSIDKNRPKQYEFFLSLIGLWVFYGVLSYITDFKYELNQYFLAVSACMGAMYRESFRVNKRIDAVLKYIEKKTEKNV